jgi:hypothetical protein
MATKAKKKTDETSPEKLSEQAAASLRSLNSTLHISRELKMGKNVVLSGETDESLAIHVFQTDVALVRVSQGMTLKMAKFQFARVDVDVTMPCYAEEVPDVYTLVEKFVGERILDEVEAAKRYFDKLDNGDD